MTEQLTTTPPTETTGERRHQRHLCLDGGVLRLSIRPHFRGRIAMIVDVSTSGIGMLLEESLEVESVLVFEVKAKPGANAYSRIARVRNCRLCPTPAEAPWLPPPPIIGDFLRRLFGMRTSALPPECFLVGCEFDRPLSETELQQFLLTIRSVEPFDD
jgi:hypothetical protein